MGAVSGTAGDIKLGGTAGTTVARIGEWSADFQMSPQDVTGFQKAWSEKVASVHSATGSFSGAKDNSDAMQEQLINAQLGGSVVTLALYQDSKVYAGSAFLNSHGPSISFDGRGETSFNFENHGAWTYS